MTEQEAYLTLHKASGLKVGDKVRVLRKAKDHEMGWVNSWMEGMDKNVGRVLEIEKDNGRIGFILDNGLPLGHPFFVLELVKTALEADELKDMAARHIDSDGHVKNLMTLLVEFADYIERRVKG